MPFPRARAVPVMTASTTRAVRSELVDRHPKRLLCILTYFTSVIISSNFASLVITVTCQAGIGGNGGWMAGKAGCTAMVNTTALLVHGWFGMVLVEFCRAPGSGIVTGTALRPKITSMENRVDMAADTGTGRTCKLVVGMALGTLNLNVCSRQWEGTFRVIE